MTTPRRLRRTIKIDRDPFFSQVRLLVMPNQNTPVTNARAVSYRNASNTWTAFTLAGGNATPTVGFSRQSPFSGFGGSLIHDYNQTNYWGHLTTPTNDANLAFAGDFTIEFFAMAPVGLTTTAWAGLITTANNNTIAASNGSNGLYNITSFGSPSWGTANTTVASRDGVWRHLALTRSGSTIRAFIDGVLFHTQNSVSGTVDLQGANIAKGTGFNTDNQFNGYMCNIRFSKVARYTANFTRPTDYFNWDADTVLLLRGDEAAVYDYSNERTPISVFGSVFSVNPDIVRINGRPTISTISTASNFGLYLPRASTTPGQGWFDQDRFRFSGDFTIESWVRIRSDLVPTSTPGTVFRGSDAILMRAYSPSGTQPSIDIPGFSSGGVGTSINNNQWTHLALVRSGTATNNVTFYVNGVVRATTSNIDAITWAGSTSATFTSIFGHFNAAVDGVPLGYFDSLRVTTGVARYTATFTPSAAPFPTQ